MPEGGRTEEVAERRSQVPTERGASAQYNPLVTNARLRGGTGRGREGDGADRKPVEPSNRALVTAPRSFAIRFHELRLLRLIVIQYLLYFRGFFIKRFIPFPDSFASTAVI